MRMELVEFLLARIAEDEERARFVQQQVEGPWHKPFEPWRLSWHDEYDLLCIDPARALAECEAKRRIVETVQYAQERYAQERDSGYGDGADMEWLTKLETLEPILAYLAQPYADHPDFNPEWRI